MGEIDPKSRSLGVASVLLITSILAIWKCIERAQQVTRNNPLIEKEYMRGVFVVIAVYVAFRLLLIVFTILLIFGLHQHKRGLVKAYLIYTTIYLLLFIIIYSVCLATKNPNTNINVAEVVVTMIFFLFDVLFVMGIWGYYLEMGNAANVPTAVFNAA